MATDAAALTEAVAYAEVLLMEVDLAASRFRADSELRQLRRRLTHASGGVRISPLLEHLVQSALNAADDSDRAVDPTVGRVLDRLGYDRDLRLVGERNDRTAVARPVPGWRRVHLADGSLTVPWRVELDLGATAKAIAADLVARRIHDSLNVGVLVSLGGDIATTGPAPEGRWQTTVQDGVDQPTTHVAVRAGTALATSSTLPTT